MNWQQIIYLIQSETIRLASALGVLLIGWIVALLVSGITRRTLERLRFSLVLDKLVLPNGNTPRNFSFERLFSRALFYLIMLVSFIVFFEALGFPVLREPLNFYVGEFGQYLPRLITPLILLVVSWLLASTLRVIVDKITDQPKLKQLVSDWVGGDRPMQQSLTPTLGNTIYWVVFLIFFIVILNSLGMQALLDPLQDMLQSIFGFIPVLIRAFFIFLFGWFLAKVAQRIVSNLFVAVGVDAIVDKIGIRSAMGHSYLSKVIGQIAYVIVLIPVLIATLNALHLDAITDPANTLLNRVLGSLPSIMASVLVLFAAFLVGKILSTLITNILEGAGFNRIIAKLGFGKDPKDFQTLLAKIGVGEAPEAGKKTPSEIVGFVFLLGTVFFASIEALQLLGFSTLAQLLTQFVHFSGSVVLGLFILALGLYLAHVVSDTIQSNQNSEAMTFAIISRISILVFTGAIALQQMGLAEDIIKLTFGLVIGAIALAIGIAFGLGGRDVAAGLLRDLLQSIKNLQKKESKPYDNNPILKP